ncbi:MAG: hypothetical protein WBD98_03365 [Acidobacteriaceae bacterium]
MNTASLVVAIISAAAALTAAWFAFKGATDEDLRKVERNTAETSKRLEKVEARIASVDDRLGGQQRYDMAVAKAQRVAVHVVGESGFNQPMTLVLKTKNSGVPLARIEMLNEIGSSFGSADCTQTQPLHFAATVENPDLQKWYSSGVADQGFTRHRVRMRVHMVMEELDVFRDIPVHIRSGTRNVSTPGQTELAFFLEGNA